VGEWKPYLFFDKFKTVVVRIAKSGTARVIVYGIVMTPLVKNVRLWVTEEKHAYHAGGTLTGPAVVTDSVATVTNVKTA